MLLLVGDHDELFDVTTIADLHQLIPHAQLAVIPGADHYTALGTISRRIITAYLDAAASEHETRV